MQAMIQCTWRRRKFENRYLAESDTMDPTCWNHMKGLGFLPGVVFIAAVLVTLVSCFRNSIHCDSKFLAGSV